MNRFAESLESRRLMSASSDQIVADLGQTAQDGQSILGDLSTCYQSLKSEVQTLTTDVKALPKTPANRKALSAIVAQGRRWETTLKQSVRSLYIAGNSVGRKAVKDGTVVYNTPDDLAARAKLLTDLQKLQTSTAKPLAAFLALAPKANAAWTAALATLRALAPSNSTLQSDVSAATHTGNFCLSTVQSDANLATTDVAKLVSDLK